MKNIKLQLGFLVEGWNGKLEEVSYAKINYRHYGNEEERILIVYKDGSICEPISRYNGAKIYDSLEEAEKQSLILKQKQILYYETQSKEYLQKAEKLKMV